MEIQERKLGQRMTVLVVDGQGGGMGSRIIVELRAVLGEAVKITAVGTNSLATSAMLKAGANAGATGENPVLFHAPRADVILGPIGIIAANSMHGEITPAMACAIAASDARKILIPVSKCSVSVAGVANAPLETYIKQAAELAARMLHESAEKETGFCR